MNFAITSLITTPFGSLASIQDDDTRLGYINKTQLVPPSLRGSLYDTKTGAFIRGLGKQYRLSEDATIKLAFLILRIALGEVRLSNLSQSLQKELSLPPDNCSDLAKDIERDIFSPFMIELNAYLAQQKSSNSQTQAPAPSMPTPSKTTNQPSNVLDLKKDWRGPTPPPFKK